EAGHGVVRDLHVESALPAVVALVPEGENVAARFGSVHVDLVVVVGDDLLVIDPGVDEQVPGQEIAGPVVAPAGDRVPVVAEHVALVVGDPAVRVVDAVPAAVPVTGGRVPVAADGGVLVVMDVVVVHPHPGTAEGRSEPVLRRLRVVAVGDG